MTYPVKFRKHVLATRQEENLTIIATADRFNIGLASIVRWLRNPIPKKPVRSMRKIDLDLLQKDVEDYKDLYLKKRAVKFNVSAESIRCALLKIGFTRKKKTLFHPKRDEEKVRVFQQSIDNYKASSTPIIYIDESGFGHGNLRTHGYSLKGNKCYDSHNWQAKGRTNVIGGLLNNKLLLTCLVTGNINSDVFHAWVTQQLIPQSPAGSVVVMDNATFHKRNDTKLALENTGLMLEYLPPYSPDLNPIEKTWAKMKAIRRKFDLGVEQLFASEHPNQFQIV